MAVERGDAWLTRHRGRDIDRLSPGMQSSRLKETAERHRRQLEEERAAHVEPEQRRITRDYGVHRSMTGVTAPLLSRVAQPRQGGSVLAR
ncbi:hypothetical protein EYF80_008969 [Liparis tanakae]|uniref:Uncharacterized protein n=1 Tax=Liparis tanakae TaxID=230148 RepID=A0A4Z2IS68_9TELE|nr:hypothetical protein EYF80_008969 [Liparis tanakae]